jgi:hypothetical protein
MGLSRLSRSEDFPFIVHEGFLYAGRIIVSFSRWCIIKQGRRHPAYPENQFIIGLPKSFESLQTTLFNNRPK